MPYWVENIVRKREIACYKNVIRLAKGSLNNIFQGTFNNILSQQLTHDKSYIYHLNVFLEILVQIQITPKDIGRRPRVILPHIYLQEPTAKVQTVNQ